MGKGKKFSNTLDFGTDDEDVYDEIDTYHNEDRQLGKRFNDRKNVHVKEVLNVEGDLSDDEVERNEDGFVSSDFDEHSDNEENCVEAPSRDQWGKKRDFFYHTSYVDKDFGGAGNEEEEEQAELEEEDAAARQRALDAAAADVDLLYELDDEAVETKITEVVKGVSSQWNSVDVKKLNKEAVRILNDYQIKHEMFSVVVEPLLSVANVLPDESPLKKKIVLSCNVYGAYLSTVVMWLSLKASSLEKKNINEISIDEHPALEHIWKLKELSDRVDVFVSKNSDLLSSLIRKAKCGKNVDVVPHAPILSEKAKGKLEAKVEQQKTAAEDAKLQELEDQNDELRRGADTSISKNKDYKNKKNSKISRMRKKDQYRKAEQKHRSQVPLIRSETSKYSGETRGIRVGTVKSIKLKA